MLTFTCPTCGTVTTVGVETKPKRPEMETKAPQIRPLGVFVTWQCERCGQHNEATRLTCKDCHKGR